MNRLIKHLQKQWHKYILEILVLIVGIYGAFALDNWNEDRKSQNRETALIKNIMEDLNADGVRVSHALSELALQLATIDKMLADIQHPDSVYQHDLAALVRWHTVYLPRTTRNHLALVTHIKNDHVRKVLQEYFNSEYETHDIYREYTSIIYDELRPFMRVHGVHNLEAALESDETIRTKTLLHQSKLREILKEVHFQQILFERRFKTYEFIQALTFNLNENKRTEETLKIHIENE